MPFTEVKTCLLIKDGILFDHGEAKLKPKSKKKKDKLIRSRLKTKNVLTSKCVKTDHFLEVDCSYLDANQVNDFMNSDDYFTIFQNNLRSMKSNMHLVDEIFQNCTKKPDIMAFGETRLHGNDKAPLQEGYHEFEHVDSTTDLGGVGFYISEEIEYTIRADLSMGMDRIEDLWVELTIDKECNPNLKSSPEKYVIGNIYRHPGSQYKLFCENLCKNIETLNKSKTKYILLGDYNIDMLKYNLATNVSNYANSLHSMGCNIHIDKPTRVEKKTATCIDHVYSNLSPDGLSNRIVMSDVSDHFSILTKIPDANKPNERNKVFYRRSKLTPEKWQLFNTELKTTLGENLIRGECHDPNSTADFIMSTYHSLIEKYMPIKTLSRRQKRFFNKPWITKGIKISIRTKNMMFKLSKECPEPDIIEKYKSYRNLLSRLKTRARNNYYSALAVEYGNDKSKIWRLVKEITKRKKITNNSIKVITDKNGNKLHDPKLIANSLNEHFSTVGEKMASKFANDTNLQHPLDYITTEVKNHFIPSPTNISEILKLILNLGDKKASGYDSISNIILKNTKVVIAPYIVKLFNTCMSSGTFPDCFKKAQVVPLFKGGEKDNQNCYRPISLLPALGKLLEKVVSIRTTDFLNKNNVLTNDQFGFRKGYSTEYAILDIYEKLLSNLDKGLNSCAIFLDLAKAFDSVDHEILLSKLPKYGIRGNILNFFKSYLTSRSQFVKIGRTESSALPIKFGVPQGSILGPLLFLLFINDLPNASNFFIKLFADDTFLCAQNKDIELLETEVNGELVKVNRWLVANKLTLNIGKSKFMIITNKKLKSYTPSVKINGKPLKCCDHYKYLGVIFDKNLSWKPHIEYICKKVSKACGSLASLRYCVNIDLLREVYHSLIHSYLRYGILVWGNASESNLQPLKCLVNRAVRIMTFAPFGRVDLHPIYECLKILDVEKVKYLETSKYLYKLKKNILPTKIGQYFEIINNHSNHRYSLRNRSRLTAQIAPRLASGQNSLQYRGDRIWDEIPQVIQSCNSLNAFKKAMKLYLMK